MKVLSIVLTSQSVSAEERELYISGTPRPSLLAEAAFLAVLEAAGVEPNWSGLSKQLTARELWSQPIQWPSPRVVSQLLLSPRACSDFIPGRGDIVETAA